MDILYIAAKAETHPHINKRLPLYCGDINHESKGPTLTPIE
jgi:hypothetical protein